MTGDLDGRLGIFARTFRRRTPEEVAAAVARSGYPLAHWNFAAIGRSTLAGDVDGALVAAVRRAFDGAGVKVPSVSATFNLIHPSAPGTGLLDYPAMLRQLAHLAPVPLIVQDTHETDAARARSDLLRWHAEATARPGRRSGGRG